MSEIIWNYLVELRKELLESQKIRAQIIGFKITFISAVFGFLFSNLDKKIDTAMFVIPALSAIFFDFLINSYTFSIKRIGGYIREHLEPFLTGLPPNFIYWQNYLTQPKTKQHLSSYGNLGLTILSMIVAIIALFNPYRMWISLTLLITLIIFLVFDVISFYKPDKF